MHKHNPDLIMALAEETLGGTAAAAAASEIAGCEQCSSDLDLQRRALAAIEDTPRVYLTATESASLREAVRQDLRLTVPRETARRSRPRRFPLGALAGAAAVLIAVAVAAPALNLLGSGDNDSEQGVALPALSAAPAPRAADAADDEPLSATVEAQSPAATRAPAVEDGLPSAGASADIESELSAPLRELKSDIDLEELRASFAQAGESGVSRMLDLYAESTLTLGADAPPPEAPADAFAGAVAQGPTCDLESVKGIPPEAVATVLGLIDYEGIASLVVAFVDGPIESTQIVVLSIESCEVIARA